MRDRITSRLEGDQPIHLIGPAGCGKVAPALERVYGRRFEIELERRKQEQ
jgi:hypothetical protein